MPEEEASGRLRQLHDIVEYHDVDRWGREFLDAVRLFTQPAAAVPQGEAPPLPQQQEAAEPG
jgi:trehalose-6-phosphate synthase